jgi:Glycosyl transferase 4-like domain
VQRAVTPPHRETILNRQLPTASQCQPSFARGSRCILLICYDYPHSYAAGVIRTYQFAKQLLASGWQPVILTAQTRADSDYDIEKSDGALDCAKISAPEMRCPTVLGGNGKAPQSIFDRSALDENTLTGSFRRFGSRLALPDGKVCWLYPAVNRAREILRLYPISICLSVSPRPTAHLVGYRLARRVNIPWVADFALPWSDAYWLTHRPHVIRWLDERLEGLVVRSAHRITVAYPELAQKISARRCGASATKIAVIPTGFDEDLFAGERSTLSAKFTVVYPGNHFCETGRHGEYFLRAVDEWLDMESGLEERIEFVFVGKPDGELQRQRSLMTHSKVVRLEKMVSHRACIQTILSAHVCVVNAVGNRVPSKVYECMRAGKWVLALTSPASDLAAIVRHYSKGMVVSACNIPAIRQALRSIRRRCHFETVEATKIDESLGRYSARYSAGLLSGIFDQLVVNKQNANRLSGNTTLVGNKTRCY